MERLPISFFRVITRSAFLAFALVLGLVLWHLPAFLNLDAFRPRLVDILESTFRCKVQVGGITAQLVPTPGVTVGHVVFLEEASSPRVLASVGSVRLTLAVQPLLKGRLEVLSIRFARPRIIIHRELNGSGDLHWATLKLPSAQSSNGKQGINEWQIRNGTVEIWDHTVSPTAKWVADGFNGSFLVAKQTGAMAGKAAHLGRNTRVDIHYEGTRSYPIEAKFSDVELGVTQPFLHIPFVTLDGLTDLLVKVDLDPALRIQAKLNEPGSAGKIAANVTTGRRGSWNWTAEGKDYVFKGTDFRVQQWSAKSDPQGLAVYIQGATTQGGQAEVDWTQQAGDKEPALDVDVSSITIRQILAIFGQTPKSYGYEPWLIRDGSMRATINDKTSLEVLESDVTLAGMHLDLAGTFGLGGTDRRATIQGDLQNIPVPSIVESFFAPPSPLTGTGQATFVLAFPLSADWIKGLTGSVQLVMGKGVLRALKTIYRISAVLNLGNYLRLRFPQVTAEGIEFESLSGRLAFQNGVLSSDDLFLKSPNMNVGAKGSVNIPAKSIDVTLRLEMFRFLEDILKYVPITHWIFKKPNKIFLPLVVKVEGPWDNPNID